MIVNCLKNFLVEFLGLQIALTHFRILLVVVDSMHASVHGCADAHSVISSPVME